MIIAGITLVGEHAICLLALLQYNACTFVGDFFFFLLTILFVIGLEAGGWAGGVWNPMGAL